MKKVAEFNKATLKDFRTELDAVLEKFGKKIGVELSAGGIRYGTNSVTVKVEGLLVGSQSKEVAAIDMFTTFKENDIIKVAQLGEVKIVGYKPRNRKYPYIVETVKGGKRYKLSETQVANRLSLVNV